MSPGFELADTDPKAMEAWLGALRAITPGKKLELVFGMIDFMHQAALRQIQKEHPEYSQRDVLRELANRAYPKVIAPA